MEDLRMQGFTRIVTGMLAMGWIGSTAHAQVVLNMPPPKSTQVRTVVNSSPGPVDVTSDESQPSEAVRVGDVALARYGRARSLPRADYGYRGRFWRPYGYGYSYGYGYYPFYFGFGHFTFGHHSHHHHDMGNGGGD